MQGEGTPQSQKPVGERRGWWGLTGRTALGSAPPSRTAARSMRDQDSPARPSARPACLPCCPPAAAPKGPPRPNFTLACNRPVSHPPPAETLSVPFQCHLPLDVLVQPQKWIPILPTFQTRKLRLRDFEVTPCSEMEPGFGWGTQGRAGPLDGDTPGPSPHCVSAPLTDPEPGEQVRSPECVPGWWAVPGW